jgi:hypothetical protein
MTTDNVKDVRTKNDYCLRDFNFIQAADVFLKEIELKVGDNIDFNKNKQEIQRFLQKFQDIEKEVHSIEYAYKCSRDMKKHLLCYYINLFKKDYSAREMVKMMPDLVVLHNHLEESNKLLSLISEVRDLKIKVDKRLKELGLKFCFIKYFIIIIFYLNLRREFQMSTSI